MARLQLHMAALVALVLCGVILVIRVVVMEEELMGSEEQRTVTQEQLDGVCTHTSRPCPKTECHCKVPEGLPTQSSSYLCPADMQEDYEKWRQTGDGSGRRKTVDQLYFCDKVPSVLDQWVPPSKYTVDDVVVGVYTGKPFYRSRALASRDTWFHRMPHAHFYSQDADDWLGIVTLDDVGEGYYSALKKQLYGLVHMYNTHPDKAWFFVVGCDFYVQTDYLVKAVEHYDHTKPIFLGGSPGVWRIGNAQKRKPKEYENFHPENPPNKHGWVSFNGDLTWPSGGGGFFLSNALMQELAPTLYDFVDDIWHLRSNAADCATALAVRMLPGAYELTRFPSGRPEPFWGWKIEDRKAELHPEMVGFHYIDPVKMLAADERYTHEKIDRIQNAQEPRWLVDFFREFVEWHFTIMRKKQDETKELVERVQQLERQLKSAH